MTIVLVGLNHRTAPVALREKLTLSGYGLQTALDALRVSGNKPDTRENGHRENGHHDHENGHHENGHYHNGTNGHSHHRAVNRKGVNQKVVREAVILSTCNRLEIYAVVDNARAGWAHIENFLADFHDLELDTLTPHLYYLDETEAVHHLMNVACGLDSMILGETQILGQVTQAFRDAQEANISGPIISHLFSQAIHAGKRTHTETSISRYTTSVSYAGALMVMEKVAGIESPNILIVGAGEMAVLAAKSLQKHEIALRFVNRTNTRAQALAEELGGESLGWHQLHDALLWADAVITATGAPHAVIYADDVQALMPARAGRPLMFVDIAVPRDVDVNVSQIENVQRFDIDDLQSIVDKNTAHREAAVPDVETIITQEIDTFLEWYYSREVTPVIRNLREWATEIARLEIEQAMNKIDDDRTAKVVNRLAHRIVNKILHEPTVRLRHQAAEGNGHGYAHAIYELFGLDEGECDHKCDVCEKRESRIQTNGHSNGKSEARHVAPSCNLQCIVSD